MTTVAFRSLDNAEVIDVEFVTLQGKLRLLKLFVDSGFTGRSSVILGNASVELIRAQIEKKSIFAVDPDSSGAKDYESLINEILQREQSTKIIPIRRSARGNRKA